ncbi:MAG: 30S ribosomal protein S9 [Spirochaetaceae bacterium]|nr:MAG: 30S ribosomal protein S9 [Spirochaetaceae bacterium]
MAVDQSLGTGRRKTAIARVYLRAGTGKISINGRSDADYFETKTHLYVIRQPLSVTDSETRYDIVVSVLGGGKSGQAGAVRHGIARALVREDENNLRPLRANGFLTRDSRMVERKKYGQPGARKKFQFSKR